MATLSRATLMIFLSAAAILFDQKGGVFAYDTEEEIRQQVGKNNILSKRQREGQNTRFVAPYEPEKANTCQSMCV